MTVVVWVFALLTAVIHIVVFAMEALLLRRPAVHERVFGLTAGEASVLRHWAVGLGFYNLFIGCGLVTGVLAWMTGAETLGQALVIYLCLFTLLSGFVLLVGGRITRGRTRGTEIAGALAQGAPPLVALVAAAL